MEAQEDWLVPLYPAVRAALLAAVPDDWPDLGALLSRSIPEPMLPEAALPLASCRAVGGDPVRAVDVSAALVAFGASLRILDDLEDRDREDALWRGLGEARATNYAAAIQALSFRILGEARLGTGERLELSRLFARHVLEVGLGQDQDLRRGPRSVETYWRLVARKTASAYELACACGARAGTNVQAHIDACAVFGRHLGMAVQILNDLESIWAPRGALSDTRQEKLTLPVLYGMSFEHPAREELTRIVMANRMTARHTRILEILDGIDARAFLVWAALREREWALDAVRACPDAEGRQALEAYMTGMFGDTGELLGEEVGQPAHGPGGSRAPDGEPVLERMQTRT